MSKLEIGDVLRAHGLHATRGRMKLLSILRAARRPLTHTEVLRRLRSARLNRVSVYRALDAFVEAGLVHRAFVDGRTWAFETPERCDERRCHPHFTCRKCGTVACMPRVRVPFARGLPKGYIAQRQKVHIEGLCPSCSGHRSKPGGKT